LDDDDDNDETLSAYWVNKSAQTPKVEIAKRYMVGRHDNELRMKWNRMGNSAI